MNNDTLLEIRLQTLGCKKKDIRQFYVLLGKRKSLRIRELAENGQKTEYEMTYKQRENVVNREIEFAISYDDYVSIRKGCKIGLYKTRYYYEDWEIDFFRDETTGRVYFVEAEIELPENAIGPKKVPQLIQEHLLHAVEIGDNRFSSRRLASIRYANKLLNKLGVKK